MLVTEYHVQRNSSNPVHDNVVIICQLPIGMAGHTRLVAGMDWSLLHFIHGSTLASNSPQPGLPLSWLQPFTFVVGGLTKAEGRTSTPRVQYANTVNSHKETLL